MGAGGHTDWFLWCPKPFFLLKEHVVLYHRPFGSEFTQLSPRSKFFLFNSFIERAGNLNDLSSLITINNLIHTGRCLHLSIGELTVKHPTPISVPKQLRAKKDGQHPLHKI